MIDRDKLDREYSSGKELIKKPTSCTYCPLEEMLRPGQNEVGILYEGIPNRNHPSREILEQICPKEVHEEGNNGTCYIKYLLERTSLNDFLVAQTGAVITFNYDLGKSGEKVDFKKAYMRWATKKMDTISGEDGKPLTYAERWREVWNESFDMDKKQILTEEGAYRIVMSGKETYKNWRELSKKINGRKIEKNKFDEHCLEEIIDNGEQNSREKLVKKNDSCPSCPYEQILTLKERNIETLKGESPKDKRPCREIAEQICGRKNDEYCEMKHAVEKASLDDFTLAQMGAVWLHKDDLIKDWKNSESKPATFSEAEEAWFTKRFDNNSTSCADRWREVWDESFDIARKQTLTEEGIYKLVTSDEEIYDNWKKLAKTLDEEEKKRDKFGANYLMVA